MRREGSAESLRKALEKFDEALLLYRAAADHRDEAITLNNIALVHDILGEKQKALDYYNQALPLWRAVSDRDGEATTLGNLGTVYDSLGEKQKALNYHNQALALKRAVGNRDGEAVALSNLGKVYSDLGEKQKALDCFNQALSLMRAGGNRGGEAITLSNLGKVYSDLGDKRKALDYYNQALPLLRAESNLAGEANTLNNLGRVYSDLGEPQKALDHYNLALPLWHAAGNGAGEATTLSNIGVVYDALGEKQKALDYYKQALPLVRAVGDRAGEATMLSNLGKVYSDLGEKQKALDYYNQALSLRRAVGDRAGEAITLSNIGAVYDALGEKQKALDYYNQALPLQRDVGHRAGEASTLSNIGLVYSVLGENQKALDYYNQALLLWRALGDPHGEATTLTNLGVVYDALDDKQKALDYYNQALPLRRAVGDRDGEASTLSNIGLVYRGLGENQKALDYYNQALPLWRAVGNRAGEATTLNNIGMLYDALDERQRVRDYYNQALWLARTVGNREVEAATLSNLMFAWKGNNPALAIFYGKQAVNTFQRLRAGISKLDKALQQTFLHSKEDTYRELADLTISAGRLAEAQQVLGLLKEEEYFEFVRRDGEAASLTGVRIAFSPGEADLEKRYSEVANRIAEIGAQRSALLAVKQRTSKQDKTLSELEAQLEIANQVFQTFLNQLEEELKKTRPDNNDVVALREAQALQTILGDLDAVALFTIVGEKKYRVILITPAVQKAYEYEISETELNKKVFAFREALQDPLANPQPLAQELYRILVGPELSRDIAQTRKQTIAWSLDGTLRYLPMAALHDGQRYLVENHRNVVITLASRDHLNARVSRKWQALGLGVSKTETVNVEGTKINFRPLLGVREELAGIVRNQASGGPMGVLPGKVMMDAEFTADAMKTALRLQANQQPFKLVHIASHFNFEPGDETKSFLLLGGGKTLTLAQLKSMSQIFSRVELLTLSACDTATGGERQGKEVEGFAVLAQRQGAHAIVASLWPVYDASTSQLMQHFYRLRDEHPLMSKAEALRQAQLALLFPKDDPQAPFAHPYFWAPFILIGNWR